MDYLTRSRRLYFNEDYIEFLLTRVLGLTERTYIVDFGCGTGYIGARFLPHLPKGSKYTGIDKGGTLIRAAEELFAKLPYETEFILGDIESVELAEGRYDVAVCQAMLRS